MAAAARQHRAGGWQHRYDKQRSGRSSKCAGKRRHKRAGSGSRRAAPCSSPCAHQRAAAARSYRIARIRRCCIAPGMRARLGGRAGNPRLLAHRCGIAHSSTLRLCLKSRQSAHRASRGARRDLRLWHRAGARRIRSRARYRGAAIRLDRAAAEKNSSISMKTNGAGGAARRGVAPCWRAIKRHAQRKTAAKR